MTHAFKKIISRNGTYAGGEKKIFTKAKSNNNNNKVQNNSHSHSIAKVIQKYFHFKIYLRISHEFQLVINTD